MSSRHNLTLFFTTELPTLNSLSRFLNPLSQRQISYMTGRLLPITSSSRQAP
jgi:hypothetical protein